MKPECDNRFNSKPTVFISYSRANLAVVQSIAAQLRACGVGTWMDLENLKPGERWKTAIESALTRIDAFVFCLSPLGLESAWTSVELDMALARQIPIVPVLVEAMPIAALPPVLQEFQVLDVSACPLRELPRAAAHAIAHALGIQGGVGVSNTLGFDRQLVVLAGAPVLANVRTELAALGIDSIRAITCQIQRLDAPLLSDISGRADLASRAVLVVGADADRGLAHLLIGALAARVGPRRLTVIEFACVAGSLATAAAATGSFYKVLGVEDAGQASANHIASRI